MQTTLKIGMAVMGLLLLALLPNAPRHQPACFSEGIDAFVDGTLKSISDFVLVGRGDRYLPFDPDDAFSSVMRSGSFEMTVGPGSPVRIKLSQTDMLAPGFSAEVDDAPFDPRPEPYTFRGKTVSRETGRTRLDSLAALYIRPSSTVAGRSHPPVVSGYIVSDVEDPSQPWYFVEPLRPLLGKVLASRPETGSMSVSELHQCLPASDNAHIVYDVAAASDGDFSMQLEPARWAKLAVTRLEAPFQVDANVENRASVTITTTIADLTRADVVDASSRSDEVELYRYQNGQRVVLRSRPISLERGDRRRISFQVELPIGTHALFVGTSGNAMKRIVQVRNGTEASEVPTGPAGTLPLVAVADAEFYRLYRRTIGDQLWWEGLMEVANLADAFYGAEFPRLRLQVQALEAWDASDKRPGGNIPDYPDTSGDDVNAYTLLCHFGQGYIEGVSTPSRPNPVPTAAAGPPGLIHLFSGHDLGPLPDPSAVSDAGAALCGQSCSKVGNDVVGLAEGIGGVRSARSDACRRGSHTDPEPIVPAAQHSVSQQAPKPIRVDTADGDVAPNTHYEATLYQRFLLFAHEIGHNLGANHSPDPTSIMYTPLQGTIRFKLDDERSQQNNKAEIRACWTEC